MTEFKTRNGETFSSLVGEVSDALLKNHNNYQYCRIFKDNTRKCYLQAIYSLREDVFYVLNESKKLADLNSHIDQEYDKLYIDIVLDNHENDGISFYKNSAKCPPLRSIPVGTMTNFGMVLAKSDNFYYIKRENTERRNGIEIKNGTYSFMVQHWHCVFDPTKFSKEELYYDDSVIRYYNTTLETLYGKEWHSGVDRNPFYQRGDVWTDEQREALIDSIFSGVPIGAIIFAKRDWEDRCVDGEFVAMEELVDGKQRYTTIIDFVSDKFKYRGKYYSELYPWNRNRFDNTQIMIGQMEFKNGGGYDEQQVLQTFIRLNAGGTSMDKRLIENAKKRLLQKSQN